MKKSYLFLAFFFMFLQYSLGQQGSKISTMDFVQILNENFEEALYYYQNNWKFLREKALKKNAISSYQLLEVSPSPEAPFNFILITTYEDLKQYDSRKANFEEIMSTQNELKLLNKKRPDEFRKVIFNKGLAKHFLDSSVSK